jgi:hypothetical protein
VAWGSRRFQIDGAQWFNRRRMAGDVSVALPQLLMPRALVSCTCHASAHRLLERESSGSSAQVTEQNVNFGLSSTGRSAILPAYPARFSPWRDDRSTLQPSGRAQRLPVALANLNDRACGLGRGAAAALGCWDKAAPPGTAAMRRIRPGPRDSEAPSRGGDHPSHWHRRFPDSDGPGPPPRRAGLGGRIERAAAS